MREIKFRAWDDGLMVYCDEFKDDRNYSDYDYLRFFFERTRNDAIVMQFTGLKDENGKEIYEGDIVNYSSRGLDFKGYVVSNGWEFYYEPIGKFSKDYNHMSYPPGVDILIIGNIFENESLLK